MRSIVAMYPSGRLTVPAEVRRALGLGEEAFSEVDSRVPPESQELSSVAGQTPGCPR